MRRFYSLVVLVAVAFSGLMSREDSCAAIGAETAGKASKAIKKKKSSKKKPADTSKKKPSIAAEKPEPADSAKTQDRKNTDKASWGTPVEKANAIFTAELKKFVSNGLVNYAAWKKDTKGLDDYLAELSKFSKADYESFSPDEKLTFWINAYNAYTIKLALDHYPIKGTKSYYPVSSIRQIEGFWEENRIELAGRKVSLEAMEHDILRRDFQEPRIHFAVVPAAKGCGKLRDEAYGVKGLDEVLEQNTVEFLSNPKNVRFDKEKNLIYVSQLFKWFPLDFASVVGLGKRFPPPTDDEIVATYILMKTPEAVQKNLSENGTKKFRVVYQEYDWALNDTAAQPAHRPSEAAAEQPAEDQPSTRRAAPQPPSADKSPASQSSTEPRSSEQTPPAEPPAK